MMRDSMYQWACDLFPIHRSITGEGLRETLGYIKNILPELEIMAINSGEKVYDWEVPQEWSIHDAWIEDEFGDRVLEYCDNNLHVVSYSEPIDEIISLDELQKHLYSLESQPDAIPYVTSYYKKVWGFCIEHKKRLNLHDGKYHVYINSKKFDGALNYGELIIKGSSKEEILLSTYVCHPSMANNELSGPVVAIALALWLKKIETRYTYRIVFTPETIGSICYINRNIETLKKNVVAGYVLTCLGDNNEYSYMPSRTGATLSDKVAKHVLKYYAGEIYVKKIPSMKVTDVALAVDDKAKQEEVGIRPGEKLHEQMIGPEDALYTYEYPGHFKILPSINEWSHDPERIGAGIKVDPEFMYCSDSNKEWMKISELKEWIYDNRNKIGNI